MKPTETAPRLARDLVTAGVAPAPLIDAYDAWQAVQEVPDRPAEDDDARTTVTVDNAAELVERLARAEAVAAAMPAARGQILDRAARRCIREIQAAGPAIIDGLKPAFDDAADRLVVAVRQIPDNLDPEHLVRAGSAALAQYEAAVSAAEQLGAATRLRNQLADELNVRAAGPSNIEVRTRYVAFDNPEVFAAAQFVEKAQGHLGTWPALIRMEGVRLWWPTLQQQAAHIATLTPAPVQRSVKVA